MFNHLKKVLERGAEEEYALKEELYSLEKNYIIFAMPFICLIGNLLYPFTSTGTNFIIFSIKSCEVKIKPEIIEIG